MPRPIAIRAAELRPVVGRENSGACEGQALEEDVPHGRHTNVRGAFRHLIEKMRSATHGQRSFSHRSKKNTLLGLALSHSCIPYCPVRAAFASPYPFC